MLADHENFDACCPGGRRTFFAIRLRSSSPHVWIRRPREAVDGREGLECVAAFHPHLVLTDLMMPVMDGIELIRRLHDDPATTDLPVVAITADATELAERQAREAGAVDVITKPIDLPALLDRLRALDVIDMSSIVAAIPSAR